MSMQPDVIEQFGNSSIQHGWYNDRIYLMKLAPEDTDTLPEALRDMAIQQGYSKIFVKIPDSAQDTFTRTGYTLEASIPGFFSLDRAVLFMAYFLDEQRKVVQTIERNEQVLQACRVKRATTTIIKQLDGLSLRVCRPSDAEDMAAVYAQVFDTYPFPIDDPAYICETMDTHVVYFGMWQEDRLVALSSAEMDATGRNVEMTDFATLPQYRGKGLATVLLGAMETEMYYRSFVTAYTIARAPSFGMNITFARMGYNFSGQLINNTNIGGQFENMNVWHKHLVPAMGKSTASTLREKS